MLKFYIVFGALEEESNFNKGLDIVAYEHIVKSNKIITWSRRG